MIEKIIVWLSQYQTVLAWLGIISLLMFVFSLLLLPWLIKKIPENYFQRAPGSHDSLNYFSLRSLLRNSIGAIILLAGLAMFVLPGQGILTVLVGVSIMQFPGKFQLERWLISRRGVLPAVNWLRRKTHSTELKI